MEKIVWYRIPFITLSFNPDANISFEVKFKLKFHIISRFQQLFQTAEMIAFWSQLNGFAREFWVDPIRSTPNVQFVKSKHC